MKNEAPYLLEWIAHHRILGIKHFFIADNDSEDGTTEILGALEQNGYVKRLPFSTPPGQKPQIPAYRHLLRAFSSEVQWMAFIDADEYIWPEQEGGSIQTFLQGIPSHVGAVALNWATYGSSGHARYFDLPTPERFTWHANVSNLISHNIKTIARTACIADFSCPHNALLVAPFQHAHTDLSPQVPLAPNGRPENLTYCLSDSVHWEHFRVNHYIIRSWEEFTEKKSRRGRAFTSYPLDAVFFSGHDFREEQTLPSPEYLTRLREEICIIKNSICSQIISEKCNYFGGAPLPPQPIKGNIDVVSFENDMLVINGWCFSWSQQKIPEFRVCTNGSTVLKGLQLRHENRPDVLHHYPHAEIDCGFCIRVAIGMVKNVKSLSVQGRLASGEWSAPLPISGATRLFVDA